MGAVVQDIAISCPPGVQRAPLETVFFGGGTPSLVPPVQLARILTALEATFGLAPGAEVSLECDPGAKRSVAISPCPAHDPPALQAHSTSHGCGSTWPWG